MQSCWSPDRDQHTTLIYRAKDCDYETRLIFHALGFFNFVCEKNISTARPSQSIAPPTITPPLLRTNQVQTESQPSPDRSQTVPFCSHRNIRFPKISARCSLHLLAMLRQNNPPRAAPLSDFQNRPENSMK